MIRLKINHGGFSLIEVIIMIVVLGIVAAVAVQSLPTSLENRRQLETEREMEMLAYAITGNPAIAHNGARSDFGYVGDIGAFPTNLQALYQNTSGYSTWQGPYLPPGFVQDSIGFKFDEWGQAYAYSGGLTITSTGSGSTITKKVADASADYLLNTFSGAVRDANDSVPGLTYMDSISVIMNVPDGAGGTTPKTADPDSSGTFTLNSLPVGNHPLRIIYMPTADTVLHYLTILPRHKSSRDYKFASAYFVSASGASDTVKFMEFTEAKLASNGSSITIPTPSGTTENDLLIAAVVTDGNKVSQLTPPGGEGWTEINISQQLGAVTLGVWWKLAEAGESSNHQFSWGGGDQQAYAWIMRFTGHNITSPINVTATNSGSSTAPTCPAVNTTVGHALILRIGGFDDDDITVDSPGLAGHTTITMDKSNTGSNGCSGGAGYKDQAAAGSSGTADFALTSLEQWLTITIAIAPGP